MVQRDRSELKILAALGVTVAVGLLLYTSILGRREPRNGETWEPKKPQPLPQLMADFLRAPIRLHSSELTLTIGEDEEVIVFCREAQPRGGSTKDPAVLLLHGAGDNSLRWLDLGTMHLAAAMGHRVIAVDLPGWGETKTESVSDPVKFMNALISKLKADKPVIVTPSASGSYVIPYIMQPSSSTCHQRASGLITVAPTATDKFTPAQYHQCQIPAMLAFGVKDTGLGIHSVGNLKKLPNSQVFPVEGAGHALMFEQPQKWHELVYHFLINNT